MSTGSGMQANDGVPSSPSKSADEYVVVARRYRPQLFSELIGQEQLAQALENAISTNRVGHAYLFTGARGVGKTSAARILAKALNCEQGPLPTPCNLCDICQSITASDDVDVLEIDGASNRGIDEIRQLRSNVNVRPSRAKFKIYIIDEVHMLTNQAFNALLKTLEEPPEHVKFIFCTTDPEKIPITVLSRCQRFDFSGIRTDAIAARLKDIVRSEGVEAQAEALELLARRASGSMRDSQSLLEQLLAFGKSPVTVDDIHDILGTARSGRLGQLVNHLCANHAIGALEELDAALSEGVDPGPLVEQLIARFRDMMVAHIGGESHLMLSAVGTEIDSFRDQAHSLGLETILAVIQILDQTLIRMRQSTQVRALVEVALVQIANLENLDQIDQLISLVAGGSSSTPPAGTPRIASPPGSSAKKKEPLSLANPREGETPPEHGPSRTATLTINDSNVESVWQQAIGQLEDMTGENAAHARNVAISAPNRLVVSFERRYNSCKSFCERPDRKEKLQQALASIISQSVDLEFDLVDDEPDTLALSAIPTSARQRVRDAHQNATVREAVELFKAEVIRVDHP